MPKYELSHSELPQFRAVLELPKGVQPTSRDLWEGIRGYYRPVGLSQLSDDAKLEAYQNGYFEEAPLQPGQAEPPSMMEGIGDLFGKAYLASFSPNSPYKKLMRMGETVFRPDYDFKVIDGKPKNVATPGIEPVQWRTEKNPDDPDYEFYNAQYQYQKQYAEAGKILFGLLNTQESEDELDDPVGIAIRRAKLPPAFAKNKTARGKAYAAALDYSTGNIEAATGEGLVRAMQGGPFVAAGAKLLFNKLTLSEDEPDEILDYVNSKIQFDKINRQYESADELAAFILENPQESMKGAVAGIAGGLTPILEREDLNDALIDKEDLTMDSQRMQDLKSGYMEPDQGISFLSEITLDPMNLAGAGAAKFLTAPQRSILAGRIKKTLLETQRLQAGRKSLLTSRHADPASPSHSAFRQSLESITTQLAEKQKILNKYARNSLFLRAAGKSAPDELLKQSAKQLDMTTDVGRAVAGMVNDAATAKVNMGIFRKGLAKGAYFTPEVAGATIGGAMLGPLGAVAGAAVPAVFKVARVLSTMPENIALRYIMRGAAESGQEVTEAEAKQRWRSISRRILGYGTILGLGYTVGTRKEGEGGKDVESNLKWLVGSLIGVKSLPAISKLVTTGARDLRAIGPELIFARGTEQSPFFNRLSQLPSPDEGLVGATRERFNTLTAATGDRLRDKLLSPVEPIATGAKLAGRAEVPRPGQFRPGLSGQAPVLSNTSRKIARFLDAGVPGLGRTLETVGQFAGKAAGGATLPATFGYLASGGQVEGALAGALVSAPFTSVGAGVGMFENYRTKADLYQRKIGDLQYYREHLSADEKVSFDALPLTDRLAMSGFSLSHPDIIFQGLSPEEMKGIGNYEGDTRTIQFNKDTGEGIVQGVIGHEIGHHIAIHGLRPMINKIMFGDSVTGEVGVYGYTDKEGNIVPNDEFVALKNAYQKVLDQDPTITQADKDRYLANEYIAEEIFADNVSDYLGAGRREKDNSWRGKIMDQVFESITGPGFLRDLILKLNVPMDSKGKFLEAGFFQGQGIKVERNVALQNLIKKYYRDTRGLRQREIEGEKVIDPASGRELKKLSKTGVRPVDPEWSESFSWDDMKDPKLVQKLNTGGLFKYQVDKNGKPILDEEGNPKVERDLLGNPKKFTLGELKKLSRLQGDFAIEVLEKYGVKIDQTADGTRVARDFSNLDPRAIDELAEGPWHPRQIITLREIALALREGDGERAGFLLGYFAASKNRKPGPVPFKIREALPYGFELTKDGNFLIRLHDVKQLEKNLEFLKGGHKKLPAKYREEYQTLFEGDDNQVWSDFAQYRRNTIEGRDGSDGLSEKSDIATRKKNFLNALHGAINEEHVQLNPILRAIDGVEQGLPGSNKPRSPFGAATKTFRLDRIFQTERTGHQASRVNVDRLGTMLMPGGRPKKPGREKRVTGRFSDDLADRIKAVAADKGISQNDALIELIEQGLDVPEVTPEQAQPIPPKESTQPMESGDPSPDRLTPAEEEILRRGSRTPEESALFRAAKKKRDDLALRKIDERFKGGDVRFMPSVEQRKASKYGQVFQEAGLNDIELAKAARIKWKEMGNSSPFVQRFLDGETNDPPMFARLENGEWKPTDLYHIGTLGVAAEKSRNPLKIFNDSPTVQNSEVWTPQGTTILTLDRKKAYDQQRAENSDQKPLSVITNAKYIFDVKNLEHTKTLDEQLSATAREASGDPAQQEYSPSDSSSLFAYENELKKLGWHGYRFEEGGVEKIAIFDSKRIKLNEDHRGEGKFYSKDRDFGKVSGLFGHRLSTDRFSANPQAEKDIRFMPQAEFDFSPQKSKKSEESAKPNWWKIYKINPKAPDVYDRVADEIIWRGSPEHDGAIAEQYSTFLNLDIRKLRPALTRAHRRHDRGDRRFMPAQDEQLQEFKDQLEMLGPDPMYRDYPELAKAIENVENFLTPDERVEYFGLKVADRQARQDFERAFGVDPVLKPASARILARQAGQYEVYDQWKRNVFDPLNGLEDVSVARRKFRTGEASKMFMPVQKGVSEEIPKIVGAISKATDIFSSVPSMGHRFERSWHVNTLVKRIISTANPELLGKMIKRAKDRDQVQKQLRLEAKLAKSDEFYHYLKFPLQDLVASLPRITSQDLTKGINSARNADPFKPIRDNFQGGQKRPLQDILNEMAQINDKYFPENYSNYNEIRGIGEILNQDYGLEVEKSFLDRLESRYMDQIPASDESKMFMPAIDNLKDGWILPDGTILPLGGQAYRINSKNKSSPIAKQFIESDEHHIAILDWVESHPNHPFAKKVLKKLKEGPYDEVDAHDALFYALEAGAVRYKRGSMSLPRVFLEMDRKKMTDAQRRAIELSAIEHEFETVHDPTGARNIRTLKTFFDGRAPDEKMFMPASEAGATKGKVAEAAKLWNEKGIDSPYFKKWFGKSKVVDDNGEPLVVYHGSKADFTEFKRSKGGEFGSGMYFSDNIDSAKMFGSFQKGDSEVVTMPVYLTLKNPLITNDRNVPRGAGIKSLIKKGYDGVIGTTQNGQKQYIAFSPEQIKSATGNRGTFDAGERNINYMPSDPKAPKAQPANRIQQQAPAMPGNRFMAPAASAGSKLSERFR
jgi:hypothetical protein